MEQQNTGAPAARPTFLTVICILSFIGSGIMIILYIMALLAAMALQVVGNAVEDGLDAYADSVGGQAAVVADATATAATVGMGMVWAYVVVGIIATILGLVGVIKMWKLQKAGFYLYVAAGVIGIIMSIVYDGFQIGDLLAPALFITLFGLNLKHMK